MRCYWDTSMAIFRCPNRIVPLDTIAIIVLFLIGRVHCFVVFPMLGTVTTRPKIQERRLFNSLFPYFNTPDFLSWTEYHTTKTGTSLSCVQLRNKSNRRHHCKIKPRIYFKPHEVKNKSKLHYSTRLSMQNENDDGWSDDKTSSEPNNEMLENEEDYMKRWERLYPHEVKNKLKLHSSTRLSMQNENDDGWSNDKTSSEPNNEMVENEEDYMKRWERLYYQGQPESNDGTTEDNNGFDQGTTEDVSGFDEIKDHLSIKNDEIRVITFDLDNTLWKTKSTMEDANNALHDYLIERSLQDFGFSALNRYQPRVEVIMGLMMNDNPNKYCCMSDNTFGTPQNLQNTAMASSSKNQLSTFSPIQLTLLRMDAIESVLLQSGYGDDDIELIDEIVEYAFNHWMNVRQKSIENNLATNVVKTLKTIKALQSNGNRMIVGAITDGNSNPLKMDMFKEYFDFCVNAETVGMAKPNRQIYLYAAKKYVLPMLNITKNESLDISSGPSFVTSSSANIETTVTGVMQSSPQVDSNRDLMSVPSYDYRYSANQWRDNIGQEQDYAYMNDRVDDAGFTDEEIESMLGPWWIHIGDDFVKDIVAAKDLNLRTVWCRELIQDQILPNKSMLKNSTDVAQNKEKSVEERLQNLLLKVSESKNFGLQMQVGAEDYLADGIKNEFCDAITDQFYSIPSIIQKWIGTQQLPKQQKQSKEQLNATLSAQMMPYQQLENDQDLGNQPKDIERRSKQISQASTEKQCTKEELNATLLAQMMPTQQLEHGQDLGNQPKDIERRSKQISQDSTEKQNKDYKFCIDCGAKLPLTAKFCSECGTKQL